MKTSVGRNLRILSKDSPPEEIKQFSTSKFALNDLNRNRPTLKPLTLSIHEQSRSQGDCESLQRTDMEAASQSLKQLGILEPTEVIADNGVEKKQDMPAKTSQKTKTENSASLTPTVILNGLAMARGETVSYKVCTKTPLPPQPIYGKNYNLGYMPSWASMYPYYGYNFAPGRRQNPVIRWIYPCIYHIEVTVGDRSFFGEGRSQQIARHNAAQRALDLLQTLPFSKLVKKSPLTKKNDKTSKEDYPKPDLIKSPISILYEKVSAFRLKVCFEVILEDGPPHLKQFTMKVTVFKPTSEVLLTAEGKGSSKIIAKTNAASAALKKIDEAPLPVRTHQQKAKAATYKASRVSEPPEGLHPCSRLCQIMQAKKESLPTYTLISSETSNPHETKHIMQCVVMGQTVTGEGKSKKIAKHAASQNMLKKLGFAKETVDSTAHEVTPSTPVPRSILKKKGKPSTADVLPPLMEV